MKSARPLLAVAALVAGCACLGAGQAEAVAPHTTYCKIVTAQDLTWYDSASATGGDGDLLKGRKFLTDRTDPPYNRYHVVLSPYTAEGWVSSDPAWTNAC